MISTLKKNFTAIRVQFFNLSPIEKVLVSAKISFGEKNCNYFIGYFCFCNDHKIYQLHIMLPKTSAYVKSYDVQTK